MVASLVQKTYKTPMTNAKSGAPVNKQFINSVQAGLAYWQKRTRHLDESAIQRLDKEHQNLYRIVDMGLKFSQTRPTAIQLIVQLYDLVEKRGYWQEWSLILKRAIKKCAPKAFSTKCQLLDQLGNLQRLDRQLETAVSSHKKAEKYAKYDKNVFTLAQMRLSLSKDYLQMRLYDKAQKYGLLALDDFLQQDTNSRWVADVQKILGTIAHEKGIFDEAEEHFRQAIMIWRQLKVQDPIGLGRALNDQARLLMEQGKFELALEPLIECEKLFAATANEFDKTAVYINLGHLYSGQAVWDKAEKAFHQANSAYLRRSGHLYLRALIANNLGVVLTKQAQFEAAESHLRQGVTFWEQVGDDVMLANTLGAMGEVFRGKMQLYEASRSYSKAITLLEQYPHNAWAQQLSSDYLQLQHEIDSML